MLNLGRPARAFVAVLALAHCDKPAATPTSPAPRATTGDEIDPAKLANFGALPARVDSATNPTSEARVALGHQLFFEKRLSLSQQISCNSCHNLTSYGVDNKPTSSGHKNQLGSRNSPTVYNAAGHFAQFWDGRAADVEAQAKGPVLNPGEMALPDDKYATQVLRSMPDYVAAFKKAFPDDKDPVSFDNFAKAIGAYERTLMTPSRWDRYLAGDKSALSHEEKLGFNAFANTGCPACHNGAYVGGSLYQKAGLVKAWPSDKDLGRFTLTKNEADRMMFKVPGLRNVEKTSPYFHDGSVASLDEAVRIMARHQLGKELQEDEVKAIVSWLKTLTGDLPKLAIIEPVLPASGKDTPKPK